MDAEIIIPTGPGVRVNVTVVLAKDNRDSGDHRAVISEMARHMGAGWSKWLICPRWTTTRYQNAVNCAKCSFVIYMNYNFFLKYFRLTICYVLFRLFQGLLHDTNSDT